MASNKRFGQLLSEGIVSVAKRQRKSVAAVEGEIAGKLGYTHHTVQRWRRGYMPREPEQVAFLVRYCVNNGRVGRDWAQGILTQARYPDRETLLQELFPERSGHTVVARVYQNLPPRYGDFLGREVDMARVLEGLASRWPLVSIEGLGGVGKTTLAIETARRCLPRPEGALDPPFEAVVWVSAKDRPEQKHWLNEVLDRVARVLDYPYITQLSAEQKPMEVDQLLRAHRTLVIVDNFETIEDPDLVGWMQRVPEPSKVLITSRHAQLRSVWAIHLRGLEEPEALELIRRHVRRLGLCALERAAEDLLLSLARVTEGNPKAIEMALGHVKRGLSLSEVVDHLHAARLTVGDIFDELFTRAWEALTKDAQHVLLVVPFFVDTVSKGALGAAAKLKGYRLDAALEQLVEMSLLDVDEALAASEQRYNAHPLTRAFAEARLREVPEWEGQGRERWVQFYLQYVELYGDDDLGEGVGGGEIGYREKLRDEINNLRLAIEWCFQNKPEKAVRLVERITTFLLDEGEWSERVTLCHRALEVAKKLKIPTSQAGLLTRLGWSYLVQGDYEQSRKAQDEGLEIARQHGLQDRLVQLLRDSGEWYSRQGDYAQANQFYAESLKLAEEIGQEIGILQAKGFRARTAYASGHYAEAKQAFLLLLPDFKRSLPRDVVFALRYLGDIAIVEQRFEEARNYLQEAEERLYRLYYEAHEEAQLYRTWGDLEKATGNLDAALEAYEKGLDLSERLGMQKEAKQLRVCIQEIEHLLT